MAGNKNSGRPKGSLNTPKEKPLINIKEVVLTMDKPFGPQLRIFRKLKKYTLKEMAELMNGSIPNICHFEKGDAVTGNSIRSAVNYAKALGVKSFKIKL